LKTDYSRSLDYLIYPLVIADQQQHIDRSEHLLQTIEPGQPAVFYWSIAQPAALVLGFSQRPDILNTEFVAASGMPIYHRHAGGTAVLVGPTLLSLDVVLPPDHPFVLDDLVESYRWFGEYWVSALQLLGIATRIVPPTEAHAQRDLRKHPQTRDYELLMNRACYGSLSPYEVVSGQRKVVGFDMIRRRRGTLLQAGVLLHWDAHILASLLAHNEHEHLLLQNGLQQRAAGLDTLAEGAISSEQVITAFEQVLRHPPTRTPRTYNNA
jgi:lipoate---protein ligase